MEKVKLNQDMCIGCGACQALVPDVFEINDEGVAEVIVDIIPENLEEEVKDASESCPVNAIEVNE